LLGVICWIQIFPVGSGRQRQWLVGEEEFLASNMNKQLAEFEAASDTIGIRASLRGMLGKPIS
jgi:hypothetical protein